MKNRFKLSVPSKRDAVKTCLRFLVGCCVNVGILLFSQSTIAQDIILQNPSLEGIPTPDSAPPGWGKSGNTPDIQPGIYKVYQAPSDGDTYVGFHGGETWREGVFQQLATPLYGGKSYSLSFDLCFLQNYVDLACYGALSIYGGNSGTDTAEVLWRSGSFTHTEWKRYGAVLNPTKTYRYIIFMLYAPGTCENTTYGVACLLDNLSTVIRDIPQVEVYASSTCKASNQGHAMAKVSGGEPPYSYLWTPGNFRSSSVSNLSPGEYKVTVTGGNGASTTAVTYVAEYEMKTVSIINDPLCYGDKGSIKLVATGGERPYTYSLDGGRTMGTDSVFGDLKVGRYKAVVADAKQCAVVLDTLMVNTPGPLKILSQEVRAVSCSDVRDGRITVTPVGGTYPYTYSIPGYVHPQQDSTLKPLDAGYYNYVVQDANGCETGGSAEMTREIRDCAVFMPNAFSPNNDGQNDIYRPVVHDDIRDYRMVIFSRWGQVIFETRRPEQGWDGHYKGGPMDPGGYLYVVTFTDSKGQDMKNQGTVVLVR